MEAGVSLSLFPACCVQICPTCLCLITFLWGGGVWQGHICLAQNKGRRELCLPPEQVTRSGFQRTVSSYRDHYSASFPSESYVHVTGCQTGL